MPALRTALEKGHFTEEESRRLTGDGPGGLHHGLASLRLRNDGGERPTVLARLFRGGETMPRASVARAIAPSTVGGLVEARLVSDERRGVRSLFSLEEFRGLIVASDHGHRVGAAQVLGVGPAARTVAALTVRRRVRTALDLCCGSGVQALLAARHAERVVAVDISLRCLRLARLSSALNSVGNVDWRRGDLFQPVANEEFDLIVANPPFIVSPVSELVYRDGGREADELSRDVVIGAARHLGQGGFATVLCNWVSDPARHWSSAPRRWVKGLGCDAWLIHLSTDNPVDYAMQWNTRPGRTPAATARLAERWLAEYRSRGIDAISTGVIVLRRGGGGRNWVRADEVLLGLNGDAGRHIERVFAAQDLLRSLKRPQDLLSARLAMAPTVRLVERRGPGGVVERARLTIGEGVRLAGPVPPAAIPVLLNLGERRSLAQAFELAASPGGPSAEALVKKCLPPIRELLARGLLVSRSRTTDRAAT